MNKYFLHWRDGRVETVMGDTIANAITRAGYGDGAMIALDYWENADTVCERPDCKSHVTCPCECGRMWDSQGKVLEQNPFDRESLVLPLRFRVWNLEQKEMYTWENRDLDGHIEYEMREWIRDAVMSHMSGPASDEWAEQTVVMQYTGMDDMNGKPIYTGDIVKFYFDEMNGSRQWVVGRRCGQLDFINAGVWQLYTSCLPVSERKVVVVGNVFENPEEIANCGYIKGTAKSGV